MPATRRTVAPKKAGPLKIILLAVGGFLFLVVVSIVLTVWWWWRTSREVAREMSQAFAEEAKRSEEAVKAPPRPTPSPAIATPPQASTPPEPFRLAATIEEPRLAIPSAAGRGAMEGTFFAFAGPDSFEWQVDAKLTSLSPVRTTRLEGPLLAGGWGILRPRGPRGNMPSKATLQDLSGAGALIELDLESTDFVQAGWVSRSNVGLTLAGRGGKTSKVFPRSGGKGRPATFPAAASTSGRASISVGGDLLLLQVGADPKPGGAKGYAEAWDVSGDEPRRAQAYEPAALAPSPSGKLLVVVGKDNKWRVTRYPGGETVFEGYEERYDRLFGVGSAYSPSERCLALAWLNRLYVVDLKAGRMIAAESLAGGARPLFLSESRLAIVGAGRVQFYDLNLPR